MSIAGKVIGILGGIFGVSKLANGDVQVRVPTATLSNVVIGSPDGGNPGIYASSGGTLALGSVSSKLSFNGFASFNTSSGAFVINQNYAIGWSVNPASADYNTGFARVADGVIKPVSASMGVGWLQQIGGRSRVSSNVTNTTITPAAITGLSHTLIAGRKYTGRLVLYAAVPTSADGIRIDFDGGTATMTSFVAQGILSDDTSTRKLARTTALATDITDTDLNGDGLVVIELGFVCNAAGTFIPRVAKEADAAGATLTVLANSFLWLEDMP